MLLLNTSILGAVGNTLATAAGIVFLGAGIIGYFVSPARLHERALFIVGAALLIVPGLLSDVVGLGLGGLAIASQLLRRRTAA